MGTADETFFASDVHPRNQSSFKQKLREVGVSFVEEYRPLTDRQFLIDVAFPDKKVGVEINGNQHYDADRALRPYYKERHDLIEAAGWTLLEIHFSVVYCPEKLEELVLRLKAEHDVGDFNYEFYIRRPKVKKHSNRQAYFEAWRAKNKAIAEAASLPRIQAIRDSGIDFSKFGWVRLAAEELGMVEQKVNGWMKRFMPDFYETNCFKKKKATVRQPSSV